MAREDDSYVTPGLSDAKTAVADRIIPEASYFGDVVKMARNLPSAWANWRLGQVPQPKPWDPMTQPAPLPDESELSGGPFQPGAIGQFGVVVRGVTPTDTAFVNQMRGWFPKLMTKVDTLPDIKFTRGWRQLVNEQGTEARGLAEYRQPHAGSSLPGGAIEIGRPFTQVKEGKWVVDQPIKPDASGQTPIPTERAGMLGEIKHFVHEALHALYVHKNQGMEKPNLGSEGIAVPSMSVQDAVRFMKSLVDDGYMSSERMNQYINELAEVRHGALDGMAHKMVQDVFSPEVRANRLAAERAAKPRVSLMDVIRKLER